MRDNEHEGRSGGLHGQGMRVHSIVMTLQCSADTISRFATTTPVPFGQRGLGSRAEECHVLVVDDNPAVLRLVKMALIDSGMSVTTAMNGREALQAMEVGGEPAAIVLDLEMPVMDGREFYLEIRRSGCYAPVLILSAFDPKGACRELRADAFMEKPFDPDALVAALAGLIEAER